MRLYEATARVVTSRLGDSASWLGNVVTRDRHICRVHGASADKRHPAEHFMANAKAHVEKHPSVPREVWLLALRARVLLVANLPVALLYE